ncbi:MAG: lipid-binding SYLF domain-containing protein [Bacteroidales bacterium]
MTCALVLVAALGIAPLAHAQADLKEAGLVLKAASVFDEIMAAPDNTIPKAILDKAEGIAVFPGMLRGAFIFGAQRGKGVISVRNRKTGTWSAPAFLTITGGSWGAQIGGQSIDLVLVIRDEKGLNNFLGNQFKIGGEASAAAGPVGRSAEASTDVQMRAQILSYSRSRGVFAGIALNGSSVHQDVDANERMYGGRYKTRDIVIDRRGGSPGAIGPWRDVLKKYVGQ